MTCQNTRGIHKNSKKRDVASLWYIQFTLAYFFLDAFSGVPCLRVFLEAYAFAILFFLLMVLLLLLAARASLFLFSLFFLAAGFSPGFASCSTYFPESTEPSLSATSPVSSVSSLRDLFLRVTGGLPRVFRGSLETESLLVAG